MIYENPDLRNIIGETLRPGGLDLTKQALSLANFLPGARIADLGCGTGASLKLLSEMGFEAIGLDCSPILLKEAATKGQALEGDFHHLPWPGESFDGLLYECSLSLAAEPERVLQESFRVLKNKGRLIISDLVLNNSEKNVGDNSAPARPRRWQITAATAEQCPVWGTETAGQTTCVAGALPAKTLEAIQPQPGQGVGRSPQLRRSNAPFGAELAAMITRNGFEIIHRQDQAKALNSLAARLVWHLGSVDRMKAALGLSCEDEGGLKKYGYDVIVARKEKR